MNKLVFSLILSVGLTASADLVTTFKKMDSNRKGPFSLNMLQGSVSRVVVNQGNPQGEFQFQAAFRNEIGQELATQHDFFVGNLFTTNYYELMGEYVYGNAYGSHALDHKALLGNGSAAFPKASSMVRHWVLEKYHLHQVPSSALNKGFKLRGISGAEFEQAYATHFFNFYLSLITEDFQFLPVYLLAQGSPIAQSSSLDRARTIIALKYDEMKLRLGENDLSVKRLYDIRNLIHNQLSQDVIKKIDNYLREFAVLEQDRQVLLEVQSILRSYYSFSAKRIIDVAKKAGLKEIQALAEAINKNGANATNTLALSEAIANLRSTLTDNSVVPYEVKTNYLVVIFNASEYLNKELGAMTPSKEVVKSIVNLIYTEGFLIKDNWQYFKGEVEAASDVKAAVGLIPDIAGISEDTLRQAFSPSLDQWVRIEPKMQGFVDNAIKSSSLNTASLVAQKANK